MITKLYIANYRSIGEGIELELGRLSALVGANGSGKSNIADALRFIADCLRTSVSKALAQRDGIGAVLHAGAAPGRGVELRVDVRNDLGEGFWSVVIVPEGTTGGFRIEREEGAWGPMTEEWQRSIRQAMNDLDSPADPSAIEEYRREFGGDRFRFVRAPQGWQGAPGMVPMAISPHNIALAGYGQSDGPLTHLVAELTGIAIYSPFPNTLRPPRAPEPVAPMASDGENWAWTLASLDRKTWGSELVAGLQRIVGDIDDYEVIKVGQYLVPRFRHKNLAPGGQPQWLYAAQESDGTLRVAAILTALFQQPSPVLLGFEEPELAIHPGAIPVLYDFLAEAKERSQILLTTHSPDLLDLLPIDEVRIVDRRGGTTKVARVEERQRALVKNRLMSASDLVHAEGLLPEGGRGDG